MLQHGEGRIASWSNVENRDPDRLFFRSRGGQVFVYFQGKREPASFWKFPQFDLPVMLKFVL